MSLPAGWKLVRVYGRFIDYLGTACRGAVRFTSCQVVTIDGIIITGCGGR